MYILLELCSYTHQVTVKRLDGREAAFSVKKLDIKVLIIKMIDLRPATVIWRGREERKPGLEKKK